MLTDSVQKNIHFLTYDEQALFLRDLENSVLRPKLVTGTETVERWGWGQKGVGQRADRMLLLFIPPSWVRRERGKRKIFNRTAK